MADFGDPSLFEEFEREKPAADEFLLSDFRRGRRTHNVNHGKPQHLRFDDCNDHPEPLKVQHEASHRSEEGARSGSPCGGSDGSASCYDSNDESEDGIITSLSPAFNEGVEQITLNSEQADKIAELTKEVRDLKRENQRLQEKVRITDPTTRFCDGQSPVIEVIYLNHDFSRTYHSEVEQLIINCLEHHSRERGQLPAVTLRSANIALSRQADNLLSEESTIAAASSTVLGCGHYYEDFIVDAMGWPLVDETPDLTDGWATPRYDNPFPIPLPMVEDEETDNPNPKKKARPKATCFNCDGDHALSDCKERRDQSKISAALREFKAQKAQQGPKQIRYTEMPDEKYGDLAPGVLSPELRAALGLGDEQLPFWVYRMRSIGYPPGWMEACATRGSGMAMFGKGGMDDSIEVEEGEMPDGEGPVLYDPAKIVSYPGFNVPCENGTLDEGHLFDMPPMRRDQSREAMVEFFNQKQVSPGVKRRSIDPHQGGRKKMRVDSTDEELSVAQLEAQRGRLAAELGEAFIPPPPATPPTPSRPPLPPGTPPVTPGRASPPCTPGALPTTPITHRSLSMTPSTPVVADIGDKTSSLPSAEAWGKDIMEHIPYENLPNATGTFEKLRKTLSSVRDKKDQ